MKNTWQLIAIVLVVWCSAIVGGVVLWTECRRDVAVTNEQFIEFATWVHADDRLDAIASDCLADDKLTAAEYQAVRNERNRIMVEDMRFVLAARAKGGGGGTGRR